MQTRVCTNCLKLLSSDRRKKGYITCVNCDNMFKISKQNQSSDSILHTSLKKDIEEQVKYETEQKEAQKNNRTKQIFLILLKK